MSNNKAPNRLSEDSLICPYCWHEHIESDVFTSPINRMNVFDVEWWCNNCGLSFTFDAIASGWRFTSRAYDTPQLNLGFQLTNPTEAGVMSKKVILHLCADTGSDTQPYQDDPNYEVVLVGSRVGVENFSFKRWQQWHGVDWKVHGIIANPVCLEFSVARSNGKARNPDEGMFLVKECQRIIQEAKDDGGLKFWVIENPAHGVLHEYIGEPTFKYEPWHYGSPWTKQTALWGDFNMPMPLYDKWEDVPKISELYIRPGRPKPSLAFMHKSAYGLIPEFHTLPQPESDMEFRSLCSQKFAKAFYEANK